MIKSINKDELLRTVGENLHTIRNAKKETLDVTAKSIGLTHPTLSKIENGRYPGLTLDLLITICNHFQISLQQALGLEVLQIFNLNQTAEHGSSGATLKQVVNEVTDGYLKALAQANSEIEFLHSLVGKKAPK